MLKYYEEKSVVEAEQWDGREQLIIRFIDEGLVVKASSDSVEILIGKNFLPLDMNDWVIRKGNGDLEVMNDKEFNEKYTYAKYVEEQ